MSKFIQLHLLTSYAPSNLNRDDLGRPKTAKMGGFDRLRVSSQSLKRTWRISEIFGELFGELGDGQRGRRTKFIGSEFIYEQLVSSGLDEEEAKKWSAEIQFVYGEPEDKEGKELLNKQLVFLSKNEELTLSKFAKELGEYFKEGAPSKNAEIFIEAVEKKNKANDKKKAKATFIKHIGGLLFEDTTTAVDIALFGRMLASSPEFNVEAACQVAHSISVHKVLVEDDYFTAVDDLNDGKTDTGSAHIGEANFAAALFYSYICINKSQLIENLGGNEALADNAIKALTEAAVKVSPKGKQNSFASRAYASYVMAELGEQQPRSLSVSYLKPVQDEDMAEAAITAIEKQAANFDAVYGKCADARYTINAVKGEGTLNELLDFVAK